MSLESALLCLLVPSKGNRRLCLIQGPLMQELVDRLGEQILAERRREWYWHEAESCGLLKDGE